MPVDGTAPATAPALIERLRAAGLVAPRTTVREAERAGLPLALACALLEKESSGGRNVYGHDPTIFAGAGKVTRANYAEYKRRRTASGNRLMQGVGPCQLTWWELQDAADAQGGCWHPEINMRVGFGHLAALVERYGRADGARRYNGSGAAAEAYSRDLLAKARRWEEIAGAPADRPRRPAAPAARPRTAATAPRVRALAADLRRREDDSAAAWRALVARGHRRRRSLLAATAKRDGRGPEGLDELLEALARIEGKLGTLVTVSQRGGATAATAAGSRPAPRRRPPSAAAILRELETLDARRRELQDELIERYVRADEELARLLG